MHRPRLQELPPPPQGKAGWPWTEETPPLPDTMPDGRPWPKFSIVTPNYNFAHYLEQTIRTILLQGYPNLEYIIIDGGSTDGSVEVIRKYEKWIAHWVSERDSGSSEAINKGFRAATGELLAWLASDDSYTPGALAVAAWEISKQADCFIIDGDIRVINDKGVVLENVHGGEVTLDRLLRYWRDWFVPPAPAVFFRRDLVKEVGLFDERLKRCSDYDYWLRVIQKHKFHYVSHHFADFCIHSDSMSGQGQEAFAAEWSVISRRYWGPVWQWRYWRLSSDLIIHSTCRWFCGLRNVWLSASYEAFANHNHLHCLMWLLLAFVRSPAYAIRGGGCGLALRALIGEERASQVKQWLLRKQQN